MVSLLDVTVSLLCIAVAGLHVLDYLLAICPHNPAGAVVLLALPTAYFTGVILVYLQIEAAPPAPVSQVAARYHGMCPASPRCHHAARAFLFSI
jgi:hypothetical protein